MHFFHWNLIYKKYDHMYYYVWRLSDRLSNFWDQKMIGSALPAKIFHNGKVFVSENGFEP